MYEPGVSSNTLVVLLHTGIFSHPPLLLRRRVRIRRYVILMSYGFETDVRIQPPLQLCPFGTPFLQALTKSSKRRECGFESANQAIPYDHLLLRRFPRMCLFWI